MRTVRSKLLIALLLTPALLISMVMIAAIATTLGISVLKHFPGPFEATLSNYAAFLSQPFLLKAGYQTLALGLTVTIICVVLGYPVAWFLVKRDSRFRNVVFLAVLAPLLVSIVVRTVGWIIILGNEGLVNALLLGLGVIDTSLQLMRSFWTVVVGLVHVLLPFMILSISSVLSKIDDDVIEAAMLLGARPTTTFLKITLPMSMQGVAAGSIIVFALTIGAYLTPIWLGRGNVNVLAIAIQEQVLISVEWPAAAASAVLLTIMALTFMAIFTVSIRRMTRR
jgi:putative spermidine/putrescine transport system permease protein